MRILSKILFAIFAIVLCLVVVLKVVATSNAEEIEPVVITKTSTLYSAQMPVIEASVTYVEEQVEEEWVYPITQEEIDLIALVTMGEAEGETEYGKRLVIDTILNRMDDPHFPNTVNDVIYYPNAFSVMWNGRLNRCYVMPEIVELVKEELLNRSNYDCVFFTAGGYSKYGKPMFQECNHYFSSYE